MGRISRVAVRAFDLDQAATSDAAVALLTSRALNGTSTTSNFRQMIEGPFVACAGSSEARPFRKPYVFGAMCFAFGAGAASGAVVTEKLTRDYSLAIPVALLAAVLLLYEQGTFAGKD